MQIHDFKIGVTLPYSEDCFFVHVLSGKEERFPKPQCDELKKRGLIILSEDWKIMRGDLQNSCQFTQCTQLQGKADSLFLAVDKGFRAMPF